MSNRKSSSSNQSRITEDEINYLVMKLQTVLPKLNQRRNGKVPAGKVLKEACNYIRRLHSEVDALSERISQLLNSLDDNAAAAVDVEEVYRNLLQQF